MRKLLIVDDEKNIRLGLKMMIEREYPDTYTIVTATHGEEALAVYRNEGADIVITDIRMPVMDGILFIEKLSDIASAEEHQPKPNIIILSGYEDFEYARAAIKYQVQEYLLKPIRRDELFVALQKCEEELNKRLKLAEKIAGAESYRLKLQSSRLQELLLQNELDEQERRELEREISFENYAVPFTVAVAAYKYEDGREIKRGELMALAEQLLQCGEGLVLNATFPDREGRVVLIGSSSDNFAELARTAESKGLNGMLFGVSEEGERLDDIQICYSQALQALQYSFIYPQVQLINYRDVQGQRLVYAVPEEDIRKLGNILGTNREKEISPLLHAIFHSDQLAELDIQYIERISQRVNEQVLDEVFRVYGEASVEVLKLYRKVGTMSGFRHFHDYFRSLEQLLFSLHEYIKGIRSAHTEHGDMKEAVAYIENNYHRSLNMAIVSNHVSLNYSYFSEAFKAYTGESFVVYLKKVRIRKAKQLLHDQTLRLADIGMAVGFENTKQFSRVFKELEGISPFEYRTKLLASPNQPHSHA
ncbi:response regulator [Paenibacillus lentus]|uniref:Response regulator n=1 Tax=Paenibacillus lentus TaxID=1338368 RepID=A0A3S8RQZ3_9BACL|nr:response regulator [Paenibacillus lentus]AZK45243.1 response regulator [Paenibacillus lentus]